MSISNDESCLFAIGRDNFEIILGFPSVFRYKITRFEE